MMKKASFVLVTLLSIFVVLINACKHEPEKIAQNDLPIIVPPIDTVACDSSNVTYPHIVQPILEAYCISCHSGPTPEGALDFDDYADVAFVAQSGQLLGALKHLEGYEPMPPNSAKISNCEITLIEKWITDTTFVMPPDTIECDTSYVTYFGSVYPIFEANCFTCHAPPTPEGGIDLTNYEHVSFLANSGQLLGSVKHEAGFAPMPDNAPPLKDCEIVTIEKWINDTTFVIPPDTTECDTSFISYPGTVYPIFESSCISCHGPPTPEGGIDLTNYEHVSFLAQSGQLLGSINHEAGFVPMPDNAPQLSECEVLQITKWVNDTTFNTGSGGIPCDPDTAYFQNDVLPLLISSCGIAGCHDEATAEGEVILTSYYYVMQTADVEPFEPWESDIIEVINDSDPDDRMPPPPAPVLSQDQKDMIYDWIAQGALNNYCEVEDCDSVNVTFSGQVFPIIQNSCYGCHSGSNPSGGISLTNHSQVAAVGGISPGNAGSLLGSITWAYGNSAMPKNGSQLSDCDIAQIRKWIDDGMPDN